jgi:hypothetical protein
VPTIDLTVEEKIDAVSDSIFFKSIECIVCTNDMLFFSNSVFDNIVCTDHNFKLKRIIGTRGNGPNSLLGINQFAIHDSILCVLNDGNQRINLYDVNSGNIITETTIHSAHLSNRNRKSFDGIFWYSDTFGSDKPVSAYNIKHGTEELFGTGFEFSSAKQTAIRNKRLTVSNDSVIYVISDNLPVIETYSKETKQLTDSYDYSFFNIVKNEIKYRNTKDSADNEYFYLCYDTYITDSNLYILLVEVKDGYRVNKIIKFDITDRLKPVAIFHLPGKIYHTFCVSENDNCIFAFEYKSNCIEKLIIPKN